MAGYTPADLNRLQLGGGVAVALSSPPTNLTAGANTALTFASTVYVVSIENNSGEDKRVAFPSPAGAGSSLLPDGAHYTYSAGSDFAATGVATMGIYGALATALNDSTSAVGVLITARS